MINKVSVLSVSIGAPVCVMKIKGDNTICNFQHLLANTLDQDEFDYVIEKMIEFPNEVKKMIDINNYDLFE